MVLNKPLEIINRWYKRTSNKIKGLPGKEKVFMFSFIVIVSLAGMIIPQRITVTATDSVAYRIFFISDGITDVKTGDYILFYLPSTKYGTPSANVIKKIVCDEGDTLTVKDRDYYCNGEYLGRAKKFSLKGQPLENFVYNGRIPKGFAFVMGESKDSFDSRYWGFIKKTGIKKVYPLW